MNSLKLIASALALVGSTAAFANTATADSANDRSQDVYRAQVLGDRAASERIAATRQWRLERVPGTQAQYLIHLGQNSGQAIAQARSAHGEEPQLRSVPVQQTAAPAVLASQDAYQRYLSGGPALDARVGNDIGVAQNR
jgi:hypothetical protein